MSVTYRRGKSFSDKFVSIYFLISLPVILIIEWMYQFNLLNFSPAIYIKFFSLLLFIYIYLTRFNYIKKFDLHNILIIFLILFFFYSFFSNDMLMNLYMFLKIGYWIFATFTCFYFCMIDKKFIEKINKTIILIVLFGSLFTFQLMSDSTSRENANAYILTWCFPMFYVFYKSNLNTIVQMLIIFSVVITGKRGAIIALFAAILFYYIAKLRIDKTINNKLISIAGLITFSLISILTIYLNQDLLSARFQDKTGSGRTVLYASLFEEARNSKFNEIILGRGLQSVQNYTNHLFRYNSSRFEVGKLSAHSDWLQFFFDFGIIGLFIISIFNYKLLKLLIYNYKHKTYIYPILFAVYTMYFLVSIYSIIFYSIHTIYLGILIAILSAETKKHQLKINNN